MQSVKLTVPPVSEVQGIVEEKPWQPALIEAALVPVRVISPLVLTIPLEVAIKIPTLDPVPPVGAAPVREMGPLPLPVEIAPPSRSIPCEAPLLTPPVPFKVMPPPSFVLIVPPVREIPWQEPPVPFATPMMSIKPPLPVTAKLAEAANPIPPSPFPWIEDVAIAGPAVVKGAPTLIPLPPPEPPEQVEKITAPLPVKAPEAPKSTPLPAPPEPPEQVEKVTVAVVPGVHAAPTSTPCAPASVDALVPEMEIVPDVLSTTPAALPAM